MFNFLEDCFCEDYRGVTFANVPAMLDVARLSKRTKVLTINYRRNYYEY